MGILLDTCVVSEFTARKQNPNVIAWLNNQTPAFLFISSFSIGELRKGIAQLQPSRRRDDLDVWLDQIKTTFYGRICSFDTEAAEIWGKIIGNPAVIHRTLPIVDTFICAIAIRHDLTIATRNVRDFEVEGIRVFNPWEYEAGSV
ncbi:MAG: type II toxin-antitoxin system VapC family toxin [Acidobacteria bacterium]|nr:type II toxin-antitoxin system VapC family toxin [Acidobacteriota bacterium]